MNKSLSHFTWKNAIPYLFASLFGLGIWITISKLTGHEEAWDSQLYWKFGVPLMVIVSMILGFFKNKNAWLCGVALIGLQPFALYSKGLQGPFGPLGFIFFIIILVPCVLGALLGAFIRHHFFLEKSKE